MYLCAVTDEISKDLVTALNMGLEYGLNRFELRTVNSNRFPFYSEENIETLLKYKNEKGVIYTSISPGLFKISTDNTPWGRLKRTGYTDICNLTERLGAKKLIVFSGKKGIKDEDYQAVVEKMVKLCKQAKKYGIMVCLENSPNSCCVSAEDMIKTIKDINMDNFRLNWDPGNSQTGGCLDIDRDFELLMPYIENVHIKDVIRKEDGGKYYLPIGEGSVDYEKILTLLNNAGYKGALTIETHCDPPEAAFVKSIKYLNNILSKLQANQ